MGKLHELIAVEGDLKTQALATLTGVGDLFQHGVTRLEAQVRVYRPIREDGDTLPAESSELATTVKTELDKVRKAVGAWIDVSVQKEMTNGTTSADVSVDGKVVLAALSAPALLNLEAKLATLRAVYAAIPTNDPTERWEKDSQTNAYVSPARESVRTKKVLKVLVLHEPTKEHPAQVQSYTDDVPEGTWTTTKRSGKLSPAEKADILERIDKLARAVKIARQRANDKQATELKVADAIFNYIHTGE